MSVEMEIIEKLRTESVHLFVPLQEKARTSDDVEALVFSDYSWDVIREDNVAPVAGATVQLLPDNQAAYISGKRNLDPSKVTWVEVMIPVENQRTDVIGATSRYMLRSFPPSVPSDITVRLIIPVLVVSK